jgi:hypothetical protein
LLVTLLVVSGLTASITGYRIKVADRERKNELRNAYAGLGGSREGLLTLSRTLAPSFETSPRNIFIASYEINERGRSIGLYTTLETAPPGFIQLAIQSLGAIDAKDAGLVVGNALKAYQEHKASLSPSGTDATPPAVDPKTSRLARRYDRYVAREVETKLFTFLREHKDEIAPQK